MIRAASGIAVAGFALLAGCVFYLVAGPLIDSDFWWHLAHGQAYLEAGPWLDADPCLGTANRGPIPHQWGFAVVARGVEGLFGLYGLRVAHTGHPGGVSVATSHTPRLLTIGQAR